MADLLHIRLQIKPPFEKCIASWAFDRINMVLKVYSYTFMGPHSVMRSISLNLSKKTEFTRWGANSFKSISLPTWEKRYTVVAAL